MVDGRFPRQIYIRHAKGTYIPAMIFLFKKRQIGLKNPLVWAALFPFLAGCSNNPHVPPLREKRADGSPWIVSYRAFPDDPRTLDPQVSYDTLGNAIISLVYDSLFQYQPFKTNPYELIPCLAASMPQRLPRERGGATYVFELKRGLTFHDDACFTSTGGRGREITAEDIAYAFKRMADPRVECPVASVFQEYVLGFREAYEKASREGTFDYSKPIAGIEVTSPFTFQIHLLKSYPQILYWMAMPFTAPVPQEAVEYYDGKIHEGIRRPQFKFHPVGTGAFRLVEWQKNRLLRLERFDRYTASVFPSEGWPATEEARFRPLAGHALPFVDELQFPIIREAIPAWLLFRQGYLDASGIGKDVFNTVLTAGLQLTPKYAKRGVLLSRDAEPATFYITFNMEDPILGKNRKLRQAICSAYDQELANQIFSNGTSLNAQQILPPGVFGHQSGFRNPYLQHDLPLARKLLAEAGYPDGRNPKTGRPLEISFDITADDASSRQFAEFQKNQIEQLGLRVLLRENLWARQQEVTDKGNFQIVGGSGWNADYPDPENFFFLFYSKNIPPKGSNHSRYANPEFDRIFEKMQTMENGPERLNLVHRLNTILVEDCPIGLQTHPVRFALNQPWAPRTTSNSMLNAGAKYLLLDPAQRLHDQKAWNSIILWPVGLLGSLSFVGILFAVRQFNQRT